MELNLKERAIIIYNLLWKYDSFKNLQLKESIESKIKFSTEEEKERMYKVLSENNLYYDEKEKCLKTGTDKSGDRPCAAGRCQLAAGCRSAASAANLCSIAGSTKPGNPSDGTSFRSNRGAHCRSG